MTDKPQRRRLLFAPLRALAVKAVLVAVLAAAVALTARHYINKVSSTSTAPAVVKDDRIDITPSQIRSIEQIGEWSFLEVDDEELIDTVRHGFFSDDELVRIYYGTLRIGVDLSQASDSWVARDGDSVTVTLPPVKLLDTNFIDEGRTKSFFESGTWSNADRAALYDRARRAMTARCVTPANLRAAEQNAASQMSRLMLSLGFKKAGVRFEKHAENQ